MLDYRLRAAFLKYRLRNIFPIISLRDFIKDNHYIFIALLVILFFGITPYIAKISSLPEDESKNITIILQYAADSEYDSDDNGIEAINGIVDFSVGNTVFALNLNESYLSTRWGIFSLDSNISTMLCYGSEMACNFVGLAPSSGNWNDTLYLYYGRYGAGYNNIVSAQVIYVNYNLSLENPFSEIYYSDWLNLSATFLDTTPIENLTNISNNPPICLMPNLTIIENSNLTINLNDYCYDSDNESLSYSYETIENIQTQVKNLFLTLIPDINFTGTRNLILHVNDNKNGTSYNITISTIKQVIDVIENATAMENITQLYAEVNKPVKWRKIISLGAEKENFSVEIPAEAFSLSIEKVVDNKRLKINETDIKINRSGKNRSGKILIENRTKELIIEFETSAPEKKEIEIENGRKQVLVYSNASLEYKDVMVYTNIKERRIKPVVYHIVNGSYFDINQNSAYNVTFIDNDNNGLFDTVKWIVPHLSEQLFEIGLATVNTNKSIYHLNEEAKILIVVLDKEGHLVSNADIVLNVTNPNNIATTFSTADNTIIEKEIGVYESLYANTDLEGNYSLFVKATGNNVDSFMISYFNVKQFYEFDILRNTPVTTDPFNSPFNSSLKIVSFINDAVFNFSESLPVAFEVIDAGGAEISIQNDRQLLRWVNLMNNSVVSYSAKPPLITPELWGLSSFIGYQDGGSHNQFQEARVWLLAVDPAFQKINTTVEGLIVYGQNSSPFFVYRVWNGTSLTSEINTSVPVTGPINWSVVKAGNKEDEFIAVVVNSSGALLMSVYNGTCWSNGTDCNTALVVHADTLNNGKLNTSIRAFDVAYENITGRDDQIALIVYSNTSNIPLYRRWNSTSKTLSDVKQINNTYKIAGSIGWIELVEMADDAGNNEIALLMRHEGAEDLSAIVWNATNSTWGCNKTLMYTLEATEEFKDFGAVYRKKNRSLFVAMSNTTATTAAIAYANKTLNVCDWKVSGAIASTEIASVMDVGVDEVEGNMSCIAIEDTTLDDDTNRVYLGDGILSAASPNDGTSQDLGGPPKHMVACGGFGNGTLAIYQDTGQGIIDYYIYNPKSNTWSPTGAGGSNYIPNPAIGFRWNNILRQFPEEPGVDNRTLIIYNDANADLNLQLFNASRGVFASDYSDILGGASVETAMSSPSTTAFDFAFRAFFGIPQDKTKPRINASLNNSAPRINEAVNMTSNVTDETELSFCQFIENQSLSNGAKQFINKSVAGSEDQCSQNYTIRLARGNTINFTVIVNDTSNNLNQSEQIIIVANTPPTAPIILYPTDNLNTSQQPLPLNVTFAPDIDDDLINITYYINGALNQTSLTNTTLNASDGFYILNVSLFDGFDYSPNATVNFTIDTTPPIVNTSLNKSLSSIIFGDVINLTANTTDAIELSFGQIIVNDTGFSRYFNLSLEGLSKGEFSQNITVSCYGGCVINFTAIANDTLNNIRTNDTIIIVSDNIKPRLNSSINNSAPKIKEVINITANVTDENALSFCQFITNQSNGAKEYFNKSVNGNNDQCSQNFTIALGRGGIINFTVIVNDTSNNLNQSEQLITVANTAPNEPLILIPTPNLNASQQPLIFNVTFASDLDNDLIIIMFYINGTLNQTSYTNTTFNASDGNYVLNVSLSDSFDSSLNSSVVFSLDTIPPRIFLESPLNNTWNNSINISFRYNASDGFLGTKNCTLMIDNKANATNSTIIQDISQHLNSSLNDSYAINWSVNCSDYAGNSNSSELRVIKIDTSFPSILNASINMTSVSVNNKICINTTVNDTYSMIDVVYAELDLPVSANTNISLVNDTLNPNSCAAFGGSVWSYGYVATEEGETNWTATYVKDFAGNLNYTKFFGLNWSQIANIFVNSTIVQPFSNIEINESDFDINNSFAMICNATCRQDSTSACSDVTIIPQYFNDSWNSINNFSSQLFTYQMNKSCGDIAIGKHCNATFNVTSSIYSGNQNFTLRCLAKGSNTPQDFSTFMPNVTINNHPTASFAYPSDAQHIRGIIVINLSSSFDDQNISNYTTELDNNNLFSSPSLICDSNQSNCTFNTLVQTQCLEDTSNCYLRLNITDNDGLKNSTFIQVWIDNTAPSIRLDTPLNNTYSNVSTISFNYTAFDTNLSVCSLYHNETGTFVINETNSTVKNNTQDAITINLLDNFLIWNIGCNDTAGNIGFNSSNFTLVVDTLNPKINFTYPTHANNTFTSGNFVLINLSINETNFANITFYLYNSSLDLVNETNFTALTNFINFSNLQKLNMVYYYNVTIRDKASRQNSTETRVITLDNAYPKINLTGTTESNNTYFNRNYIFVNATVNETNFANATFYLYDQSLNLVNETNITQGTDIQNLSINFTPTNLNQRYYYNATVRDKAGLVNYTETRQIVLDNSTPAISLIKPRNNTLTNNNTINFTYYLAEPNIKNCTLYSNFSGIFKENLSDLYPISGVNNNLTLQNVQDGLYLWNVRCYDLAGNDAFNATNLTLDVDTTPPAEFNLSLPANATESINRSPMLNWTEAYDVHFLNYTLIVDNNIGFSSPDFIYKLGGNYSNTTFEVPEQWTGNTIWYWKVIAYDQLNQSTNSTNYFTYIIDNGSPQINLTTPFNHSVENQSLVSFNFNVTDANTVANCSLIINGETKSVSTSITKNESNTIQLNLANGNYNWSINCTDRAGNINESVFRNITVNAPPLMSTKFVDTTETDFGQGTLHLTNISGSGANANVTLNFTVASGNMSAGQFIYNITGNFTSRIFDTGAINTNLSMIKWYASQSNSSFVMGWAMHSGARDVGAFYRNGSIGTNLNTRTYDASFAVTTGLRAYTIPSGWDRSDIIGFGWDDDNAPNLYALFRNGSVASTAQADLTTNPALTTTSSFTLPANFNTSNVIGFAVDSAGNGAGTSALFFKNGSFIVASAETPPFTFSTVRAFTITPAGFKTDDVIGADDSDFGSDVALFFRNGSYVANTGTADFSADIAFNSVFTITYDTFVNLTTYTNITLQTRASNDTLTWSPWSSFYDNYEGSQLEQTLARFIQYKAVFTTQDKYITPFLENVSINYTETNNPRINFTEPTPLNNSFLKVNFIYINVSIIDEHSIDKCILEFNGINESLLILRDGRNTTCFTNKSSLLEGKHGFRAYANDTFGNMNFTDAVNVTIDLTSPIVTLLTILPNPANYTFNNITVNFTTSDLYLNDTYANVSYPNRTTLSIYSLNFTLTPDNLSVPGNYSITIISNDTAGNTVKYTNYFFVNDTMGPGVELLSPSNNTVKGNKTVVFYYTPQDDFNVSNCTLILNGRLNITNYTIEESIPNNFTLNLSEGQYVWGVNCTDSYMNTNSSNSRLIIVDLSPPNITLIFPENDFNSSIDWLNFNWTSVDNFDFNISCNLTVNNIVFGANITNLTGNYSNFTAVNLSEGANLWNVTCIDDANNTNTSAMRNFTVVKGPSALNITLADDNESINLSWAPVNYSESYSIYIIDRFSDDFGAVANVSGIKDTNYTDATAGNKTQRFYKIASVKGSANKTTIKTVGKYEFELINNSNSVTDWNLISLPLNITNFVLTNGSNNGSDLRVKPLYCIKTLWFYNATIGQFMRTNYNGSGWTPVPDSSNFTSLEIGRGYWAEVNQSCNLTFVGEVPLSNATISLETGWNVVGWYSPNLSSLPINYQPPYPIVVNPANSVKAMNRYNPVADKFEATIHYTVSGSDWGWWPSANNRDFTSIEPIKGYYYDVLNTAAWVHKPNTNKE